MQGLLSSNLSLMLTSPCSCVAHSCLSAKFSGPLPCSSKPFPQLSRLETPHRTCSLCLAGDASPRASSAGSLRCSDEVDDVFGKGEGSGGRSRFHLRVFLTEPQCRPSLCSDQQRSLEPPRDVRLSRGPWRDCPLGAGPLCLRRALSRAVVPSFGAPVSEKKGRLPGSHTREFILGEARFSGVCIQHPSGLLPALWRQRHSRPLPIPLDQKRPHMPSSQPCLPAGKPFLIAHLTRLPLLVLKIHLFIKIHVLGTYHMLGCRTGDIVVNKKRRSPFLNSSPFSQKLLLLLLLLFCLFVF